MSWNQCMWRIFMSIQELGVFKLIFDQVLIDQIVRETNQYARTVMGDSKYENSEKLGTSDIYAYFGIMIMMGLVNVPCLHTTGGRTLYSTVQRLPIRYQEIGSWRYTSIFISQTMKLLSLIMMIAYAK